MRVLESRARPPHGVRHGRQRFLLPDDTPAEILLELDQPLLFRLEHLGDGNTGPHGHDLGDVFRVHLFLQVFPFLLDLGEPLLERLNLLLELRNAAVGDLRRFLEVTAPRRLLRFRTQLLHFGLLRLDLLDRVLLRLPLRLHGVRLLAQLRELLLDLGAALFGGLVLLLRQRLTLDLELHDLALDFVDLLRQRIDGDAEPRRGLVDQVDGFVGQEAVGDVAVRQRRRRDDRIVGDADAVVNFVPFLEAAQNRDRVFDRRLTHEHWLEAPLERGVLLDVLAVLVQRRRPHDVELAARQRRLQHVGGVHRPFGLPRADERVQLIDEHDVTPFSCRDLFENRLESLLEFSAELGARDERADVERDEMLVLQRIGDVAVHNALRQPFDDRGLADAGLTDQYGIVLGAARQHLHHATDLFVPADDGIEFPLAGDLGEIAGEALQRLVLVLGLLIRDAVRAAHAFERGQQLRTGDAIGGEQLPRRRVLLLGERQEQMLGRDVGIAERFRFLVGAIQDARQLPGNRRISAARLLGKALDLALRLGLELRDVEPRLLQQRHDDSFVLLQQREEKMRIVDDGIALGAGERGRLLQSLGGFNGESIWLDHGWTLKQWACRGKVPKRQKAWNCIRSPTPFYAASRLYFMMIIFFVNRLPSTTS